MDWIVWIPVGALGAYGVANLVVAATPSKKDDEALQRVEEAAKGLLPKLMNALEVLAVFRRGSLKWPGSKP